MQSISFRQIIRKTFHFRNCVVLFIALPDLAPAIRGTYYLQSYKVIWLQKSRARAIVFTRV